MQHVTEKEVWDQASLMLQNFKFELGSRGSSEFRKDPIQLIYSLSRYKFSSKMIKKGSSILELGCREAVGAFILAEQASSYLGVDRNPSAIATAQNNLKDKKFALLCEDFKGKKYGSFDAVVSFDQLELYRTQEGFVNLGSARQSKIGPNESDHSRIGKADEEERFCKVAASPNLHNLTECGISPFSTILQNLNDNGVCVIGTKNRVASDHQSLFDAMKKHFHQVFPFCMYEENVHVSLTNSDYLIFIGFLKR